VGQILLIEAHLKPEENLYSGSSLAKILGEIGI